MLRWVSLVERQDGEWSVVVEIGGMKYVQKFHVILAKGFYIERFFVGNPLPPKPFVQPKKRGRHRRG